MSGTSPIPQLPGDSDLILLSRERIVEIESHIDQARSDDEAVQQAHLDMMQTEIDNILNTGGERR